MCFCVSQKRSIIRRFPFLLYGFPSGRVSHISISTMKALRLPVAVMLTSFPRLAFTIVPSVSSCRICKPKLSTICQDYLSMRMSSPAYLSMELKALPTSTEFYLYLCRCQTPRSKLQAKVFSAFSCCSSYLRS